MWGAVTRYISIRKEPPIPESLPFDPGFLPEAPNALRGFGGTLLNRGYHDEQGIEWIHPSGSLDEMTSLADGLDAYGRILVMNPSEMEHRGNVMGGQND